MGSFMNAVGGGGGLASHQYGHDDKMVLIGLVGGIEMSDEMYRGLVLGHKADSGQFQSSQAEIKHVIPIPIQFNQIRLISSHLISGNNVTVFSFTMMIVYARIGELT